MSRDYYFHKWRNVLDELHKLIEFDLFLQTSKSNEEQLCLAAFWLTGMLARYMIVYKEITTCLLHNLQVQKIEYYEAVAKSVENRISELKNQLTKLESTTTRFFSNSLICHKLTPYDIEPKDFCIITDESRKLNEKLKNVWESVRKKKEEEELAKQAEEEEAAAEAAAKESLWQDDSERKSKLNFGAIYEVAEKISETELERRACIKRIQAQERNRQVIKNYVQNKQKRERWERELNGTLQLPARLEIRERAANLIQNVARKYFDLKRKKILDCKRDELLGLQFCDVPKQNEQSCLNEEKLQKQFDRKTMYEAERDETHDKLKSRYIKSKVGELREDHGDFLRAWFYKWYKEANKFFDIPNAKQGGSTLILKEEIIEPYEWVREYNAYIEAQRKNKNKTDYQKKAEAQAKKMEKKLKKKLLQISKKQNLADFSGYDFPESKTVPEIQNAISLYHNMWEDYDRTELFEVKEKYIPHLELIKAITEIKKEICYEVDIRMQKELKLLKKALKADYANNEEEMPEAMKTKNKKKRRKKKRKKHLKTVDDDEIKLKLEEMVENGYLKEYPKTYFDDYFGDHNFIGDDIRCLHRIAQPYAGELRNIWWDKCRQAAHEFQRILLVGPRGSGRCILAHIMATANGASFYEFNPDEIQKSPLFSAPFLEHLVSMTMDCIRETQPAVVFIRHVENLYLKKPQQELKENSNLMKTYFIKKLCKFNKTDLVTVIASCSEPWETKMAQIQKRFPICLITPNTSYAVTSKMLQDWVTNNRVVPSDFWVSALAHMVQDYEFSFLKHTLYDYLSGERLTRILYRGLDPSEVFTFVEECAQQFAADNVQHNNKLPLNNYEKYWEYYLHKTSWGKKELKHQKNQMKFAEQRKILAEKEEKKRKAQLKMLSNVSSKNTIPE